MKRLTVEDFWARVQRGNPDSCWPWLGPKMKSGYGQATISRRHTTAHRLAFELTNGAIPEGLNVLHRCDNRICCNPNHHFLGTQKDNIADMWAKGRQQKYDKFPKGEKHWKFRYTDLDVLEIRERYKAGQSQQSIADSLGLSQTHVSRVVRGEHRSV